MVGLAVHFLSSGAFAQAPEQKLDQEFLKDTIEQIASIVEREYFAPEVAASAASLLRQGLHEGRYDGIASNKALAECVTGELLALTKDKHLAVGLCPDESSPEEGDDFPDLSREERGRQENFGVQRVEILTGNVGYLNFTSFYHPEEVRDALLAAMRVLRHADALIIDMRTNGGGSPDTVALVASFFFDEAGLPLFEIVNRSGETRSYSTEAAPLADRNASRPVYVLISAQTFSAGEGFALILQERQRAKTVGETTAGAANPGKPYPVNAQFEIVVPNGRIMTAITGGSWEGVGVRPDIHTTSEEALRVAHDRALESRRQP